jgi:histidine triad (HIT) family protein
MTECIIDLIIDKQIKAYTIFEDENYIAFLDHRPVFPGHTLVAPKHHVETLYDLPEGQIHSCFSLVQRIGRAVKIGMRASGTFVAINNMISQSIPHLHIHVIPRNKGDGLKGFFWPRVAYQGEEHMVITQTQIKNNLSV